MADTPNGETEPSKNDAPAAASAPAATPAAAPAQGESVEELRQRLEEERKAREQATMRANQLENEKKAREEEEAKREAQKLEEQNQYKELYEQEKAKREAEEADREERERKAEIEKAKQSILGEVSEAARETAKELGLDLTDSSDEAQAAFKEKLAKLDKRVAANGNVAPNNPAPRSNTVELTQDELRENLPDEHKFHDIVTKKFPGIAAMTNPRN